MQTLLYQGNKTPLPFKADGVQMMSNFSLFYSTTYVVVLQFLLTCSTSFLIIRDTDMVLAIHSTTLSQEHRLFG